MRPRLIIIDDPYLVPSKDALAALNAFNRVMGDLLTHRKFESLFEPILIVPNRVRMADDISSLLVEVELPVVKYDSGNEYDLVHGDHNGMRFPTNRRW